MKYKNKLINLLSILLFNLLISKSFSYHFQNYFCINRIYSDITNLTKKQINNLFLKY